MHTTWLLLVLLPTVAISEIRIKYTMAKKDKIEAKISGYHISHITDAHRETYGITDIKLKAAVRKLKGFKFFDVYINRHPERGDLYKSRNWPPLKILTVPTFINITKQYTEPIANLVRKIINPSDSEPIKQALKITDQKSYEISHKWKSSVEKTISASLTVSFSLINIGIEGSTSTTWGKEEKIAGKQKTSVACNTEIIANPRESVTIHTNVTEQILVTDVKYETTLTGIVVVKNFPDFVVGRYGTVYTGEPEYHFIDIKDLRIPTTILTSHTMTTNYNKEFRVLVKSKPFKK
nr:venom protein U-MPTX.8-36 [Megalopyge opercularis]